MVGIILAAGAGSRLHPLTSQTPKTLLEIGPSLTILGLGLASLSRAGCDEIAVVVGDNSSAIHDWLREGRAEGAVEITLVPTERDTSWNNAFSLWAARDWLARGAMILNGDTVVPSAVVEALAADVSPGECFLAVDLEADRSPEQMKVSLADNGHVVAIGKDLSRADSHGEFIGLSHVPPGEADAVASSLEAAFAADRASWYEDGYGRLIASGATLRAWPIGDVEWVEVDTPEDLARARALSWLSA